MSWPPGELVPVLGLRPRAADCVQGLVHPSGLGGGRLSPEPAAPPLAAPASISDPGVGVSQSRQPQSGKAVNYHPRPRG